MKLEQTHRGEKRIFTIQESGVKITEDSSFGYHSRTIPFENITNEFISLKFNPIHYMLLIIVSVLFVFSFLVFKMYEVENLGKIYGGILVFLIGGIFGIINYKTASTVLRCIDYEGIEFFKNTPTKEKIDSFVSEIFKRRNAYLKKRYEKVNLNLNYNFQYAMFYNLLELEIIDIKKFDQLIVDLDAAQERKLIFFSEN